MGSFQHSWVQGCPCGSLLLVPVIGFALCGSRVSVVVLFVHAPFALRRGARCGRVRRPRLEFSFARTEEHGPRAHRLTLAQLSTQHLGASNYAPCELMVPSAAGFGTACCSGMDFGVRIAAEWCAFVVP